MKVFRKVEYYEVSDECDLFDFDTRNPPSVTLVRQINSVVEDLVNTTGENNVRRNQ